jgi:hypothetical protein
VAETTLEGGISPAFHIPFRGFLIAGDYSTEQRIQLSPTA